MIPNTVKFTSEEIFAIFGVGQCRNIQSGTQFTGISIDSREIAPGNIFVALRGERMDGHSKVFSAIENGAAMAVVSAEWLEENDDALALPLLVVKDTQSALAKFGRFHRDRFSIPVLAVGGSNGKTTTKEMIAHLAAQKYKIVKTHENFNNQLGLPLMLFLIDETTELAIIEIGTNEPGEIATLAQTLNPTHGILTNIGKEHLEKLIDLDGVEAEETSLFAHLIKHGGTRLVNLDDERLAKYTQLGGNFVSFGVGEGANVRAAIEFDSEIHPRISFNIAGDEFQIEMRTQGYTTALNAIAAAAAAHSLGLTAAEIKAGLESFRQDASHGYGRMVVLPLGCSTLINDCYNANPNSMNAAFFTLKEIYSSGKRYAALGDMRELGASSLDEHVDVITKAMAASDEVFLTGDEMLRASEMIKSAKNVRHFGSKDEMAAHIASVLGQGDVLLVKGSRGMKMEELISAIRSHKGL